MYLVAYAPTVEQIQKHMYFELEKAKINETDWVTTKPLILEMQAQSDGISVAEKRKQINHEVILQKTEELKTKLGFTAETPVSQAKVVMNKYKTMMDRMENTQPTLQEQTLQNMMNKPELPDKE